MGYNSFEFAAEVSSSLLGNENTLAVANDNLNIWTDTNAELTKAWQIGDPNNYVNQQIAGISAKDNGPPPTQGTTGWFIANIMDNPAFLNQFSSESIIALSAKLTQFWDSGTGSASATENSEIGQYGNLISATSQRETADGAGETKTQGSFISQAVSAQQPISDAGNSAIGVFQTVAGLTQTSFL